MRQGLLGGSVAETCSNFLTNKYDPRTAVFWQTHPPTFP